MAEDFAIGQMDRQITIQSVSYNNSNGARTPVWSNYAPDVWARREDGGGSEGENSNQLVGIGRTKFFVYNNSDTQSINRKMRVRDGSEYFYIKAINRIGNIFFELETELRDNE